MFYTHLRENRDSGIYAKILHKPCSRILYYADVFNGPLKRSRLRSGLPSLNNVGVGSRQTVNGAPLRAQDFIFILIKCIFFLIFPVPFIHDGKYGDRR